MVSADLLNLWFLELRISTNLDTNKKNKAEISVAKSDLVFKLLTNIWNTLRPISTWCSTSAVRRDVIVIINIIVDTL